MKPLATSTNTWRSPQFKLFLKTQEQRPEKKLETLHLRGLKRSWKSFRGYWKFWGVGTVYLQVILEWSMGEILRKVFFFFFKVQYDHKRFLRKCSFMSNNNAWLISMGFSSCNSSIYIAHFKWSKDPLLYLIYTFNSLVRSFHLIVREEREEGWEWNSRMDPS